MNNNPKKSRRRRRRRLNEQTIKLRDMLLFARDNDIPVDICGTSCNANRPFEVMQVMQTSNYMVDYEGDNLGRIVAIHIDKVSDVNY